MAKDREKEIEAVTSIADTLAREGCSLVPGGGIAYDSIKALVNYGKKYYENRNNKRLETFHKNLLIDENGKPEAIENLNKKYSADDYYSLLKSLLQDEEDEKVRFYSALMKSIINGNVNKDHKKYFIRTLKDLSCYDLDLIRKLFIFSNFEFTDNGSVKNQLKQFGKETSPITKASLSNLIRLGYIDFNQDLHIPTTLLEDLAKVIFSPEEIKPLSIGKEELHQVDIFVATFVDDETLKNESSKFGPKSRSEDDIKRYSAILSSLKSALEQTGQSFLISNPERFTEAQKSAALIILCLDTDENPMIVYSWDKELLKKEKVFKIILDRLRTNGKPYDTLPGTEASKIFDFTSVDENSYNILIDEIKTFFRNLKPNNAN